MRVYAMLAVISAVFACGQEAPTEFDELRRGLNVSAAEVNAEEEILGGVYSNGIVPTSSTMWVRLVPLGGGAGLRDANGNQSPSDRMPIKVKGSRFPAKTTPDGQWGWYDAEASDGPCRPSAANKSEVHDFNMNGIPDGDEGGGIEKHCAKPGSYRVELLSSQFGSVVASREIDKVRISGSIPSGGALKGIEDPNRTSGGSSNVADVFVHFDTGGNPYNVSGGYTVDNATTGTVNDTVGTTNDFFRFDGQHGTTWPGTTRGELLAKYNWGDLFVSRFSNTDQVIRAKKYGSPQTYPIQADVVQPRGLGITGQLRKVIVQAVVATVTVSPSSAIITTQNGTVSLTATLRDANGNIVTGRPISWSSSNTSVATVSGSGTSATVTGNGEGSATITASSEGKSGSSTITVSFGTDNAAAAGNTLPTSFENGSAVSVTVSMNNNGQSTWTSAAGYALDLSRDQSVWAVTPPSIGATGVVPGATKSFAFTLRTDDPSRRGVTACFFQMRRSVNFFGAENGKDINVTGPKIVGGGAEALTGESIVSLGFDPAQLWLQNASDDGTTRIPLDAAAFRQTDVVSLSYAYAHDVPRSIDVVFKYVYEPTVFEPLPIEGGVSGVTIQAGVGTPGEYWVRFTGTVPEGNGLIAGLPFRLLPGARAPRESTATLTIYQVQN